MLSERDSQTDERAVTAALAELHQAYLVKIDAAVHAGREGRVRELAQAHTDEALRLMTAQSDRTAAGAPDASADDRSTGPR